ncbi:T9SS C-terminal target domain-containing protein [Hymenobacter sediminis]|uniref:T9SS type A sorting domain-containing protein n=1 Tax=Hymenobacter sediminis TaxID=2218621 RepID=UPI000DA6D487|nr:T9SS type A sorting domain-containing protein [Hymenobacter sediminis]RPD48703.1 T9SS C-terminal target domain-containing protein [Hymenobacter sediminis]
MMKKITLVAAAIFGSTLSSQAQGVNGVTEIITDFGGFWQSSATTVSAVKPDNSHDLLAFTLNGVRYSTGVDDDLLTTKGISFTKARYQALPLNTISGALTGNTKVGLGEFFDGVRNGASSPTPRRDIPYYLRDGRNGLNLGTGVANVPAGTLDLNISQVTSGSIGDGIPDILVTQFADPSSSQDSYQFLDENGNVLGGTVTVTFTNIPTVGRWTADFYEASSSPMTLQSGFTQTDRDLRLWSADLLAFNIKLEDVSRIRKFRILLSGSSDLAFVAYNTASATFVNPPLPVQLTSFVGEAAPAHTNLTWQTAQELNSAAFEVEASSDGRTFRTVGKVAAAGTSAQAHTYRYQHAATGTGTRFYRLRQVDVDGSSTYSSVLALSVKGAANSAVRVVAAPNPFRTSLQLRLSATEALPTSGSVQLTTLAGQTVYQQNISSLLTQAVVELPQLPRLPAGVYMAQVVLDGHTTFLKVVRE